MGFWQEFNSFRDIQDDLKDIFHNVERPGIISSLGLFFSYYGYSLRLMFKEKELLLFIFLQWSSIAIGYYLFVMMLYWIPEEVWRSTENNDKGSIADVVLFLWMIMCIGVASLPFGIFSSCMSVVHFLRSQGKESTIAACLKIVLPRFWSLWVFHWFDGYVTVERMWERLPSKNDRTPISVKLRNEALYYAWKVATMGILPNLITGRSVWETSKNTIGMIKENTKEVLIIRTGYSVLCWIVATITYVIGVLNFGWIAENFLPGDIYSNVAKFYFIAGIPLLISIGIIQIFIRPAYILSLNAVYVCYMQKNGQELLQDTPPSPVVSVLVTAGTFLLFVFVIIFYRYELGIMDMLATPYGVDY